jgi:prepilin-type N-terminal cleavage/methylation domain-containing protein
MSRHRDGVYRHGFTLVELLVVIAIIGVLVALLLPAVQAAREASRRSQCGNHLKQIGMGFLNHESTHKFLPSAGWSPWVVGDPDMGAGRKQPGGWMYQILPFIEQQALHRLPADGKPDVITPEQLKSALEMQRRPVVLFHCPSRRPPQTVPFNLPPVWNQKNANPLSEIACGDYAANAGDNNHGAEYQKTGQDTLDDPNDDTFYTDLATVAPWLFPPYKGYYGTKTTVDNWPPLDSQSGINFTGAEIEFRQIPDGASNTYMVGEKNLDSDCYEGFDSVADAKGNYGSGGDGQGYFAGFDWDTHRWAHKLPIPDTPGGDFYEVFGSAHPAAWHVALCDGSVRAMSYDVDLSIHKRLANRQDGREVGSF